VSSGTRNYGDPETRRRILDAALRAAADLGPSMRLADVSRAAGISHQGLYLHFGGRDGLLLALLSHMVERFEPQVRHQRVLEAPDGRTALREMVEFLGFMNEQLDSIGWVLEEAQHLDKAFGRDWRRRVVGMQDAIESGVVTRLSDEGSLRKEWSVPEATDLFVAITTLGAWRELTRELGWTPSQYVSNAVRLLETSLLST
jgi:AcrR family transcriptional regulator